MTTPGNYLECVQGTELWAKLRCGYITASRAGDVIAVIEKGKNKGQEKADRANYRMELICERLTGVPYPQYVSRDMQWGLDHEAEARAAYEIYSQVLVDTCGFVLHPSIPMFGASPDGLVGDDGLIQIKCPTTKTHLEWLQADTIPVEHVAQMLAEMSCTGRDWVDFVSYDPRLPAHLQLFGRRYKRDEKLIATLEAEVVHFNSELEAMLLALPPSPQPVAKLLDWPKDEEAL
jgi:putative phage-type endonuclease